MNLRFTAVVILSMFAMHGVSFAQGGAVPSPPSNSFNWLNLNRNGNSAASNYYQLVRPQFQNQNAIRNIQQDYNNLTQSYANQNNDPNSNTTIRDTGHAATFMSYSHYYPNLRGSLGAGGARTGGGGGGTAPAGRR